MLQNAAMPSPIRVSPELYEAARKEAAIMHRSVAGQLEYWAKLGEAVEAAGLSIEDVKEIFYRGRIGAIRGVREVNEAVLNNAKQARQRVDYEAQRDGLVSPARMSPFAGVQMAAKIREVPLDE